MKGLLAAATILGMALSECLATDPTTKPAQTSKDVRLVTELQEQYEQDVESVMKAWGAALDKAHKSKCDGIMAARKRFLDSLNAHLSNAQKNGDIAEAIDTAKQIYRFDQTNAVVLKLLKAANIDRKQLEVEPALNVEEYTVAKAPAPTLKRVTVSFLGTEALAQHVVYVFDRSGSMAAGGAFDLLKVKLAESVARLTDAQTFHVIFFGGNKDPVELGKRALVPATPEHKQDLVEFLDNVIPEGETLVMSSLKRALEVLGRVPTTRPKLILLLSDGGFEGFSGGVNEYRDKAGKLHKGNDAVVTFLDENNKKIGVRDENGNVRLRREVRINTYLLRGSDATAIKVMKNIAEQHDGTFTHIQD